MIIMKKLINILAVLVVLCTAGAASAQVGSRNLAFPYQVLDTCYYYNVWTTPTEIDFPSDGIVALKSVDTGGTNNLTFTTAEIASFAYPARLTVQLADVTANDSLVCTSATLEGYDQFGKKVRETISTLVDATPQVTNNVFRRLTAVSAIGCSDGTDATDALVVALSSFVGLGVKVRTDADVEMACLRIAANTSYDCATDPGIATAVTLYDSTTPAKSYTFDMAQTVFDGAAGVDDTTVCFRIVPSFK